MLKVFSICFVLFLATKGLYGCTEFLLTCEDDVRSKIVGRTMEFAFDFPYSIISDPANTTYTTSKFPKGTVCSNNQRLSWTAESPQLGLIAETEIFPEDSWVDGQNGDGLSVGSLYFPVYGEYPEPKDIPKEKCTNTISHLDVNKYIQTKFSTVQQLKSSIENDEFPFVYGQTWKIPKSVGSTEMIDFIYALHWSVYDRTGDSLVLEYSKDGRRIFHNDVGVFTNSPTFDWHLTNLNNYVHLQKTTQASKNITDGEGNNHMLKSFGSGTGLLGVPGDFSPPGRLVRTSAMVQFAQRAKDTTEGAVQAWHIINSVDITKGTAPPDATGWSVVKDLNNNVMYFRDYDYLSIRKIELNKIVMNKRKSIVLQSDYNSGVVDVTYNME